MYQARSLSFCFFSLLAVVFLTGCSASFAPSPTSVDLPTAEASTTELHASLYGGQQPISGAHVFMFAADTATYGGAVHSLLAAYPGGSYPSTLDTNSADATYLDYYVTTNAVGVFNLAAGQYSCSVGQFVYIYAIGGNPGSGANSAAGMLSVLGQCAADSRFPGVTYVTMNEVSTIAAAYALSGFAVDATHIGYPSTSALATIGMTNAVANAGNLYNISAGGPVQAMTTNGDGTIPQTQMNTLANILAGCVNSTGPTAGGCPFLLVNANSTGTAGGTAATDTATAAINMAHHPGYMANTILNAVQSVGAPFGTSASSLNDLTLGITYAGGGMSHPKDIAVDGNGAVWVSSDAANTMTKLTALGAPVSSTGYTVPDAGFIAIDTANAAWVTSASGNAIYSVSSGGTVSSAIQPSYYVLLTGTFYLSSPQGLAIDQSGDVLVASPGNNYIFKLNTSGSAVALFNNSGTTAVNSVAVDTSNDVWSLTSGSLLDELGGVLAGQMTSTTSGMSGAKRLAMDASGNVWVTNYTSSAVSKYTSSGNQSGTSPYTGGGMANPNGLVVDGASNVWIANQGNSTVSEFANNGTAMSPANGFTGGSQSGTQSIAVDPSGNVWVTNTTANNVTELIGAATPTITPIAAATIAKTPGVRP